jgi:regulatory protein
VAADLLSRRAWTRAELLGRLKRRGAPDDVATAVVDDLVARGHVDDAAFAAAWVQGRGSRGYGTSRLRADLRRRGVASALIEAAVATLSSVRQVVDARTLAERRYPALVRAAPARAAARLRDLLLRRGFSPSVVQTIVREVAARTCDAD